MIKRQREKEFIANVSHELKTPITIIQGYAETLLDQPDLGRDEVKKRLEAIVRACGRLDKMVKGLLALSRVEEGEDFEPCDLVAIGERCKQHLLSAYPDAAVSIKEPLPRVFVLGHPNLLELAMMNLLENSAKYSLKWAEIEISFRRGKRGVEVQIADRGRGIPKESLPHIFDRFYTVDKGGSGLGLSIVKSIIERHKGKIEVSSTLGQGSVFTLIFPDY